ncbi:hypothetical protein F0L68_07945 [Solihabitans fulvus]|uniref:Uncharacterized protein n=1 Tax=Solihabitans fulvus TaxID=1892852 RepID=A0A5B2XN07_9PSEU|nr:hypothetical protein [Solihabitans fulvus]KAA2264340.1 hypothetical protein F0L68_07945 [Solihabitans fulvus]
MSWQDFYLRRDVLDAVLRQARRDPAGPLPFTEIPGASTVFADRDELLLALHYKWMQQLTGRVGLALADAERSPDVDRVDAVTRGWRDLATAQPTLRAVLDAHLNTEQEAARRAVEREQRMLALAAGLADAREPDRDITRVGAAFQALLRSTPTRPARRRGPVEQLLRRLVPTT